MAEVKTAVEQGEVVNKCSEIADPEELTEEFLNGLYFGDGREHRQTNLRIFRKLCIIRSNEENEGTRSSPRVSIGVDPKTTVVRPKQILSRGGRSSRDDCLCPGRVLPERQS